MIETRHWDQRLEAAEVRAMVAASRAEPRDTIEVAGPQGMEYAVALLRADFENVVCVSNCALGTFGEAIDHLFVSGPMTDEQLRRVVTTQAGRLRPNGSLVAILRDAEQDRIISRALHDRGFVQSRSVVTRSGRVAMGCHCIEPYRFSIAA